MTVVAWIIFVIGALLEVGGERFRRRPLSYGIFIPSDL